MTPTVIARWSATGEAAAWGVRRASIHRRSEGSVQMTKRNMAWLAVVIAVGAVVWVAFGVIPGLLAAGVVLILSEVVERRARAKRRAAQRGDSVQ
jgi:hypothetical protein